MISNACRLLPVLESSIEELMHMRRVAKIGETNKQGQPVSKRKHLNKLEIVKKKSIYGMWIEPILFIKAYLYDPGDITRLAHTLDVSPLMLDASCLNNFMLLVRKGC